MVNQTISKTFQLNVGNIICILAAYNYNMILLI